MKLNHYGFIVLAPDYQPNQQQAQLKNEVFHTEIVGVSSVEHAIDEAKKMIERGTQLIELCGGFGEDKANQVINALDTHVPIGYVGFSANENTKLTRLLE
ncbi:DUF6506 family protein [Flocculibacter collagenilyticus]|uniref:DUF6506 family protein n=1 Tax=Flocculibacter collagenilyticus TaxID=2744479 RepID=UPI0018F4F026|nr:DUF6506 family protein [Flocculibacter collagenilyticus]